MLHLLPEFLPSIGGTLRRVAMPARIGRTSPVARPHRVLAVTTMGLWLPRILIHATEKDYHFPEVVTDATVLGVLEGPSGRSPGSTRSRTGLSPIDYR